MKLDSIVADERRIARTYPNGVENYEAYKEALVLFKKITRFDLEKAGYIRDIDAISRRVAEEINRDEPTIRRWLKGVKVSEGRYKRNKPHCTKGIVKLNEMGLLHLTYYHGKFPDVNLLYAFAFCSGFSGKNMLETTPKELSERFEAVLKGLDLGTRDRAQRKNVKDVSEGAAAMNRLFRCMTLSPEAKDTDYLVSDSLGTRKKPMTKGRLGLGLPYYLSPLMNPDLDAEDRKLADRILYDFVSVLFSRRTYISKGSDLLEHTLQSSRDMRSAKRFALEVEALIRKVIPGFTYHYKPEPKDGYVALRMWFKLEDFPDPNVFRFNKKLRQLYAK